MPPVVTTSTGYRNLQQWSHVHQGVSAIEKQPNGAYDTVQYRRVIHFDIDETERDNLWLREEVRKVLTQNELLRHRFRYAQLDEERKRNYELERRRQEEEERRRWEEEVERRRLEDEERCRLEDESRRRHEEERRKLEDQRRRLEEERKMLEEMEKKLMRERQQKPPPMGRFPDPGDLVSVFIVRGEDLRQGGRYAPLFVKVGFEGQSVMPYRTLPIDSVAEPSWHELLHEMPMPLGARNLQVEVWEEENREKLVGTGLLDLRYDENEIHAVDIFGPGGRREGKVYVRYSSVHPPPPPLPQIPSLGHSHLDLEVLEGHNLVDLDTYGKGDVYVQFCWDGDRTPFFSTKVVSGRNPEWNEGVKSLRVPDKAEYVALMVWDKDRGEDDFMGMYRLHLLPPPDGEFRVQLYPRENEPDDSKILKYNGKLGELLIRAVYNHVPNKGGPVRQLSSGVGHNVEKIQTVCRVTIIAGEGFTPADANGLADPYVTIGVGKNAPTKTARTTTKKKTLTPVWNESFDLNVPEDETYLVFNVYDEDRQSRDDYLGQTGLDVRGLFRANRSGIYRLYLQPRAENVMDPKLVGRNFGMGRIRVKVEWGVGTPEQVKIRPNMPPRQPTVEEIEEW